MRLKDDPPCAIDVGTFVMNYHHNLLRLGVVRSKRSDEHGWAWFKVDFLEDDIYIKNKTFHSEVSGKDQFQKEHRVDQLMPVSPRWLQNVLNSYYTRRAEESASNSMQQ